MFLDATEETKWPKKRKKEKMTVHHEPSAKQTNKLADEQRCIYQVTNVFS